VVSVVDRSLMLLPGVQTLAQAGHQLHAAFENVYHWMPRHKDHLDLISNFFLVGNDREEIQVTYIFSIGPLCN
jgi:hypothetical protein